MTDAHDQHWPRDADGDVLRRLHAQAFDFSVPHRVEFEIDFGVQPDEIEVVKEVEKISPHITRHVNERSGVRYFVVELEALITYEFVVAMQHRLSQIVMPFGGKCEAWGLLH